MYRNQTYNMVSSIFAQSTLLSLHNQPEEDSAIVKGQKKEERVLMMTIARVTAPVPDVNGLRRAKLGCQRGAKIFCF
jgi:hypothetical protein